MVLVHHGAIGWRPKMAKGEVVSGHMSIPRYWSKLTREMDLDPEFIELATGDREGWRKRVEEVYTRCKEDGRVPKGRTAQAMWSRLKCEVCGKEFPKRRYLTRHMDMTHRLRKEGYPCGKGCGKVCATAQGRGSHERSCDGKKPGPWTRWCRRRS